MKPDGQKTGRKRTAADAASGSSLPRPVVMEPCERRTLLSATFGHVIAVGTPGFETGNAVAVDSSGNQYVLGAFTKPTNFNVTGGNVTLTPDGPLDIYLAKYSSSDVLIWVKQFGGAGSDTAGDLVLSGGNLYFSGTFSGGATFGGTSLTAQGASDAVVGEVDTSGNVIWADDIGGTGGPSVGRGLAVDTTGNVYLTGYFTNEINLDPFGSVIRYAAGGEGVFVEKLNSGGGYVWGRKFAGPGGPARGNAIAVDTVGDVYTTGFFTDTANFAPGGSYKLTSAGHNDIFVSKLDSNGRFVWADRIGGPGQDVGRGIALDSNDNVLITGNFRFTITADPNGQHTLTSRGIDDILVEKLDANGNYVWAQSMGGVGDEKPKGIAIDAQNNVYTTGYFQSTANFDPQGSVLLTSNGSNDLFISELDANGNYVSAQSFGGTGSDVGNGIALDANGNIYLTGFYSTTVNFNPSGSAIQTAVGEQDIFVLELLA